jgi:hypothetical protein
MEETVKKLALLLLACLMGCVTGKVELMQPSKTTTTNSKVIDKPREAVWNSAVPMLGKQFFVINNLDKSSGLMNISYAGDPDRFVDCGRIRSTVNNMRGERTYEFAGESANENYEAVVHNQLFSINRKMALEGRMNLVFEEVGPNQTRVTTNTRYVVTRNVRVYRVGGQIPPQTGTDTISFNSGAAASFPKALDGRATECAAKGVFESDVLSLIN